MLTRRTSSIFRALNTSTSSLHSEHSKRNFTPPSIVAETPERKQILPEHKDDDSQGPQAWVAGHREKVPYDLVDILESRKVLEIWDDTGDCFVYLSPQDSEKPASFRVKSSLFQTSRKLIELSKVDDSTGESDPEAPKHLYIPMETSAISSNPSTGSGDLPDETEHKVSIRNLFAFLMGRSLIATERCPSVFDIFTRIAQHLKSYEFSNVDGSSFGEVVVANFEAYIDEFGLADVRTSDEKTIQGVVLGERMRSVKLYNEAFTHAAGKFRSISKSESLALLLISPATMNRLSRAAFNVEKHVAIVNETLESLEFPSMFSGIVSSKHERKHVDFNIWRDSFSTTRKFYIHFYKQRYKKWPPKSTRPGTTLNRLILKDLYQDLCSAYDLLVDRSIDPSADLKDSGEPRYKALKQIFAEYNRSSPPVKPAIPFDLPIMPKSGSGSDNTSEKINPEEVSKMLAAASNSETDLLEFTEAFKDLERKHAHSKKLDDIIDHRMGQWIFIYALLQVLPLLVVDGVGVEHTKDVEYFLCEPPRSGIPWARDDAAPAAGTTLGVPTVKTGTAVNLPADLAEPGIEGLFYRSHCWRMAEKWRPRKQEPSTTLQLPQEHGRISSNLLGAPRVGRSQSRTSLATGVRPVSAVDASLSVPGMGARTLRARPVSVYDPTRTFDSILTGSSQESKKKG
ncbi:hypothetical protein AAFC00_003534 [Neodothiora populina]